MPPLPTGRGFLFMVISQTRFNRLDWSLCHTEIWAKRVGVQVISIRFTKSREAVVVWKK